MLFIVILFFSQVMTYPLHMTLLPSPCAAHWRSWLMGEAFEASFSVAFASPKSRFVSFVAQEYACGPSWEYAGSGTSL